jgi:hypothetical protein
MVAAQRPLLVSGHSMGFTFSICHVLATFCTVSAGEGLTECTDSPADEWDSLTVKAVFPGCATTRLLRVTVGFEKSDL